MTLKKLQYKANEESQENLQLIKDYIGNSDRVNEGNQSVNSITNFVIQEFVDLFIVPQQKNPTLNYGKLKKRYMGSSKATENESLKLLKAMQKQMDEMQFLQVNQYALGDLGFDTRLAAIDGPWKKDSPQQQVHNSVDDKMVAYRKLMTMPGGKEILGR